MATLGVGLGTGYPTSLDARQTFTNVNNPAADDDKRMDAEVLNDVLSAIVAVETELGVTPSGASATVAARLTSIEGSVTNKDHGTLLGLGDDDHSQYALLAGRAGGQTIIGGTAASENLVLRPTSNATEGFVIADSLQNVASKEVLRLRSQRATRASGDEIYTSFYQPDSAGASIENVRLVSKAGVVTAGSVNASFQIWRMNFGTLRQVADFGSTETLIGTALVDINFRVPASGKTFGFVFDAGANSIGVGGGGTDPVSTGGAVINAFEETNETASKLLAIGSLRSTRAVNDEIFMSFYQPDDAGTVREFARITSRILDVGAANPDGELSISHMQNGTLRRSVAFGANLGNGVIINPDAVAISFIVTGDTTTVLHCDAGNEHVGIGGSGTVKLHVTDSTNTANLEVFRLTSTRATRVDEDSIFATFYQPNNVGAQTETGRIASHWADTTGPYTRLALYANFEGTMWEGLTVDASSGAVLVNRNQTASLGTFRVLSSTSATLFFVDIATDKVGINIGPSAGSVLHVNDPANAVSQSILRLRSSRSVRADNDEIFMDFFQPNDGGTLTETSRVVSIFTDVTAASMRSRIALQSRNGGAMEEVLTAGRNVAGSAIWGLFGSTQARQTYTVANPTTDRALDVTGDTLAQVAAVLGTLIADLQAHGAVL